MSLVTVSSKGQITIPMKIRTFLGVGAKDKLELILRGKEVVLHPVKPFRNFRGSVKHKKGYPGKTVEDAAARHVMECDK